MDEVVPFFIRALILGIVLSVLGLSLNRGLRWWRSREHPWLLRLTGGRWGNPHRQQGSRAPGAYTCPNDGGTMVRVLVNQGKPDEHIEFECQSCNTAYNPATGQTFTF